MRKLIYLAIWSVFALLPAGAGTITQYTDRATFDGVVGATTIEDFGNVARFPITTGVLNSSTNLVVASGPPITPGLIKPGVTYSTPVAGDPGVYDFNIDTGGGFTGGLLDSLLQPNTGRLLTVTFDGPVTAFGFDTNYLMGQTFDIAIFFLGGGSFTDTVAVVPNSRTPSFYGFVSSAQDIQSIQLNGDYSTDFGFALDNFTFTDTGEPGSVPEPSTIVLMAAGLLGIGAFDRKRRVRG